LLINELSKKFDLRKISLQGIDKIKNKDDLILLINKLISYQDKSLCKKINKLLTIYEQKAKNYSSEYYNAKANYIKLCKALDHQVFSNYQAAINKIRHLLKTHKSPILLRNLAKYYNNYGYALLESLRLSPEQFNDKLQQAQDYFLKSICTKSIGFIYPAVNYLIAELMKIKATVSIKDFTEEEFAQAYEDLKAALKQRKCILRYKKEMLKRKLSEIVKEFNS